MGHFSNGTEQMVFESEFCDNCIHGGDCPVMFAHFMFSYDLCNDKEHPGKKILDILIDDDGCNMFSAGESEGEEEHNICGECVNCQIRGWSLTCLDGRGVNYNAPACADFQKEKGK